VQSDLASLRLRVGTVDKTRLDQHLSNIRAIENRIGSGTVAMMPVAAQAMCAKPTRPTLPAEPNGKEAIEERMAAMSGLIAMALACDQTRVFSIMFSGSVAGTVFWQVGATSGHHDLTHNEAGDQPLVQASTVFTMKQFGTLLSALKGIPEGAGNLLDSCAIIGSTDTADGKLHSITDYPIVIGGRAGGALKYPGVHYRSLTKENTSTVLMSLLKSVGLPLTEFGAVGGHVTTGCAAIEA
jgi:hypothetical protein